MRKKIDIEKVQKLSSVEEMLEREYGSNGTTSRETFNAKAKAWYYAEVLNLGIIN